MDEPSAAGYRSTSADAPSVLLADFPPPDPGLPAMKLLERHLERRRQRRQLVAKARCPKAIEALELRLERHLTPVHGRALKGPTASAVDPGRLAD